MNLSRQAKEFILVTLLTLIGTIVAVEIGLSHGETMAKDLIEASK